MTTGEFEDWKRKYAQNCRRRSAGKKWGIGAILGAIAIIAAILIINNIQRNKASERANAEHARQQAIADSIARVEEEQRLLEAEMRRKAEEDSLQALLNRKDNVTVALKFSQTDNYDAGISTRYRDYIHFDIFDTNGKFVNSFYKYLGDLVNEDRIEDDFIITFFSAEEPGWIIISVDDNYSNSPSLSGLTGVDKSTDRNGNQIIKLKSFYKKGKTTYVKTEPEKIPYWIVPLTGANSKLEAGDDFTGSSVTFNIPAEYKKLTPAVLYVTDRYRVSDYEYEPLNDL